MLNSIVNEEKLKETKTVAFLVLKQDLLLYEYYAGNKFLDEQIGLFSISKSVVSPLIGIALKEGYIKSLG